MTILFGGFIPHSIGIAQGLHRHREFHRGPIVTERLIRAAKAWERMEQKYWLARKQASVANAEQAKSSVARLIHLDLAGRYSVKAAGEKIAPSG